MLHKSLLLSLILLSVVFSLAAKTKDDDKSHKISIKNLKYDPPKLTIKPGESVTWTNLDDNNHTVISDDKDKDGKSVFASDDLANGDTFTHKFDTAGKFPYHCKYHPRMKGVISVAD